MADRRFDGLEDELGGIPFEQFSEDATASPDPIGLVITMPAVTATGGDVTVTPDPIAMAVTMPAATAGAGAGPTPAPIAVAVTMPMPFVIGDDIIGDWVAQATSFPTRIGATVLASEASDNHQVVVGTSSRPVGAAAVLTGAYGFRGLYAFAIDADTPGNFTVDARDWVILAGWGDFALSCRRNFADAFDLRVDWVLADSTPAYATSSFTVDSYASLGFAATRDATSGEIVLYRSDDGWDTWTAMPISASSTPAGALADSIPEGLELLAGDLQDGPWVQVFAATWAATTDLDDFDTDEVTAWNYGANIVTGLGGDFYDEFDGTTKDLFEHAGNSSYAYKLRYETAVSGTTRRVDWTLNAPTLATGTPTAGTEAAFAFDMTPQWEDGPGIAFLLPPLDFEMVGTFDINNFGYSPGGAGFGSYDASGQRPPWRAILCDINGTSEIVLENAMIRPITYSLNEPDSWVIDLPVLDPQLELVNRLPYQEVQVWRGDQIMAWGPMVRERDQDDETVASYQCLDAAYYFQRRRIGTTPPTYVYDGSFELGVGWFHGTFEPSEPAAKRNPAYWDWEITSERYAAGTPGRSLKLSSTDDMIFGIVSFTFLWVTIDPADRPDGITWTAAAWAYVPSATWVSERNAAFNWQGDSAPFGLHLERMSTTEWEPNTPGGLTLPKLLDSKVSSIDEDFPKDTWVRLEVQIVSPADDVPRTDWIQVELHAPIGTIFWDEVTLTRDERLRFDDVDQATILQTLVEHAQDPAVGKSDLNIDTNCPPTGVLRSRVYEWFNHQFISTAVEEFPSLWNGVDWSIAITGSTRTFTTHYPMMGSFRPAYPLLGGKNIAKVSFAEDGDQAGDTVTVLADTTGTGSGRDEVRISDSTFSGGLVLELVIQAAKESPLSSLVDQAGMAWRQAQDLRIPTLTTFEGKAGELLGAIHKGDVVYVDVTRGSRRLLGYFRIMAITVDPKTETMDITVNPFDDYIDPALGQAAIP